MRAGTVDAAPLLRHIEVGAGLKLSDEALGKVRRAQNAGYLSVVDADWLVCKVLKLHPALLWPEWFDLWPLPADALANLVMEEQLGRSLRKNERVEFVDGNEENLDPDNLRLRRDTGLLSEEAIAEIRSYELSKPELALKYGVSMTTIARVRREDPAKKEAAA